MMYFICYILYIFLQFGQSIIKHKWFKGVDWDAVERKGIPAPWIPFLKNDEDVSWFEKYPDSKNPA